MMPSSHILVKAAQSRLLLLHHINNLTEPAKAAAIYEALAPKLQHTSEAAVLKLIQGLGTSGQVEVIRDGRHTSYFRKKANGIHAVVEVMPATEQDDDQPLTVSARTKKFKRLIDTLTVGDARAIYLQLHKMFKDE